MHDTEDPGDPSAPVYSTDIHSWSDRASATFEPLFRWVREHQELIVDLLEATGFQGPPPNWQTLTDAERHALAALIAENQGTPVAWTPPGTVLSELLGCSSADERQRVLLGARDSIEHASRALLAEVNASELLELRDAVVAAWDAYAAGHQKAAQALASACATAAIQGEAGLALPKLADLVHELERLPPHAFSRLWKLREAATLSALAVAFRNDRHARGQPGFNRHLSLHSVASDQYTEANALQALMLVTATVRELQEVRTGPLGPLVGPNRLRAAPDRIRPHWRGIRSLGLEGAREDGA